MRAAAPVTAAAAKEVPKFPSSSSASTGPTLSLSRLLKAAIEAASNPGIRSLPGATMIGAILRDSGVAGPRDEKVAMFARLSDSAKGCKVISSERVAPTVTMFLAVEGGGIWIGLGMKVEGQGTGQSSVFVPLKKSGMTRGLQNSGRVASISAPLLPAGPNTRKSRLLYRKVSMSADC